MKEEPKSDSVADHFSGARCAGSGGGGGGGEIGSLSISSKIADVVQRCAYLESENAVLSYKLRRMRRTIQRLGQDNAFLQRRLREHLHRRGANMSPILAAAIAAATGRLPSHEIGTAVTQQQSNVDGISTEVGLNETSAKLLRATGSSPSSLSSSSITTTTATTTTTTTATTATTTTMSSSLPTVTATSISSATATKTISTPPATVATTTAASTATTLSSILLSAAAAAAAKTTTATSTTTTRTTTTTATTTPTIATTPSATSAAAAASSRLTTTISNGHVDRIGGVKLMEPHLDRVIRLAGRSPTRAGQLCIAEKR